jgi:hypothetical protein
VRRVSCRPIWVIIATYRMHRAGSLCTTTAEFNAQWMPGAVGVLS